MTPLADHGDGDFIVRSEEVEELTLEVGITSVSRFCHMGIIQKRLLPRQLVEAWKTLETQTQLQK